MVDGEGRLERGEKRGVSRPTLKQCRFIGKMRGRKIAHVTCSQLIPATRTRPHEMTLSREHFGLTKSTLRDENSIQ